MFAPGCSPAVLLGALSEDSLKLEPLRPGDKLWSGGFAMALEESSSVAFMLLPKNNKII